MTGVGGPSSGTAAVELGAAAEDSLGGTSWNVTGFNNGRQMLMAPIAGTTITLSFSTAGTVGGFGGCNTYSGSFQASGDAITFGPIASTQKACDPAVMDQESQFFAALGASRTHQVTATATAATGVPEVTITPPPTVTLPDDTPPTSGLGRLIALGLILGIAGLAVLLITQTTPNRRRR